MRSLQPVSPEGELAVALARQVASSIRTQAGRRDADGRFAREPLQEVVQTGLAAATVPADLGGGGVRYPSDLMSLVAALAVGDGSVALATNMHLGAIRGLSGARSVPFANDLLSRVADGHAWVSAAVTEAGTNFFNPRATLQRTTAGWVLDGDKVFSTGSPMATHLVTNVGVQGGDADGCLATVVFPADRSGVEVIDDWDGLGMRASGSGRVRMRSVELLDDSCLVMPGGPIGTWSLGPLVGRVMGNVANVSAMCGIAEAAAEIVREHLIGDQRVDQPLAARATVRQSYAELVCDLHLCHGLLRDLGRRCDELVDSAPADEAAGHALMAEFQIVKRTTNRAAISVVDRALELAGGRGYVAGGELARLYRDVRAGPFMQPFTPHEALGYIGSVALDVPPDPLA